MIFIPNSNLQPGMIVAKDIWGQSPFLPLIHTGYTLTTRSIRQLINANIAGIYIECDGLEDIQVKECIPTEVKVRVSIEIQHIFTSLKNEKGDVFACLESFSKISDYLVDLIAESNDCFTNIVDMKNYNEYSYIHCMQVGILSTLIGKKLDFNIIRLKNLSLAGMLHDIGKLNIPLAILDKQGPLTDDEFVIMKQHPSMGVLKLNSCKHLSRNIFNGIGQHHEKIDGSGYPNHLKGDDISTFGKIIAIADVYDALTSNRSYRNAWESHKAINYMMSCADSHFDVELLRAFLSVITAYPVGILVRLNNGLVGVVIETVEGLPLNPIIKVMTPGASYGKILDLAQDVNCLSIQIVDTVKDSKQIMELLEYQKIKDSVQEKSGAKY